MSASDPRDSSLETPFVLPTTWPMSPGSDTIGSASMMSAALIMMTRNRYLAWPAAVLGISGFINSHPTRSKDGGTGWSSIVIALCALFASYLPLLVDTPPVARASPFV